MRFLPAYIALAIGALLFASVVAPRSWNRPLAVVAPRADDDRSERLDNVRDSLALAASDLEQEISTADADVLTRDLTHSALFKCMQGEPQAVVESLIDRALEGQVMEPRSPEYGNMPWRLSKGSAADEVSLAYTMLPVGAVYEIYGSRFTPEAKSSLTPHLAASIAGLRRLSAPESATSLCLLKATNLILLGEAAGDARAADDGYALLDRLVQSVQRNGIGEFDSPTYYWVDLNAAGVGYRLAARLEGRARFRSLLDYLWTDIAANFFPGTGTLAGPMSRTALFTSGRGALDLYLYIEGLRPQQSVDRLDLQNVLAYLLSSGQGYRPDSRLLDLARRPEKVVLQRRDADPSHDRYHFVTREFSIGTANGGYGPQDRPISAEVASGRELVNVAVVADDTDQPYGRNRVRDRSGLARPIHLQSSPAAVQEKGAALVALDPDPAQANGQPAFATNILLPLDAQRLTVDGRDCPKDGEFEMPAGAGSVIGIREGQAAIAIRLIRADTSSGKPAKIVVKADAAGRKVGAARLVIYHRNGTPTPGSQPRSALLILAAACPTDAEYDALLKRASASVVTDQAASPVWQLSAEVGQTKLELKYDLAHRRGAARTVNGKPVESRILTVNGEDLAARAFASLSAKK